MAQARPMATAPRDGTKVRVLWTDRDGQENESLGQYRDPSRLTGAGGQWDDGDAGWWVFVDGETQKRVQPHGWLSATDGDEDE